MKFDVVKVFWPTKIQRVSKEFSWYVFAKKSYDVSTKLTYLEISHTSQFFCEKTGKSLLATGLKDRKSRLVDISDPENRRVLCQLNSTACYTKCDSDRYTLSNECECVVNLKHMKNIARYITTLGFDGIAVNHDCLDEVYHAEYPICQNATFIFRDNILKNIPEGERCELVRYAKKYNSQLHSFDNSFPTCLEIDELLKNSSCSQTSKNLHAQIRKIFSKK